MTQHWVLQQHGVVCCCGVTVCDATNQTTMYIRVQKNGLTKTMHPLPRWKSNSPICRQGAPATHMVHSHRHLGTSLPVPQPTAALHTTHCRSLLFLRVASKIHSSGSLQKPFLRTASKNRHQLRDSLHQGHHALADVLSACELWGSPGFVSEPELQKGGIKIPKWAVQSQRGLFVGFSAAHASTVCNCENEIVHFFSAVQKLPKP